MRVRVILHRAWLPHLLRPPRENLPGARLLGVLLQVDRGLLHRLLLRLGRRLLGEHAGGHGLALLRGEGTSRAFVGRRRRRRRGGDGRGGHRDGVLGMAHDGEELGAAHAGVLLGELGEDAELLQVIHGARFGLGAGALHARRDDERELPDGDRLSGGAVELGVEEAHLLGAPGALHERLAALPREQQQAGVEGVILADEIALLDDVEELELLDPGSGVGLGDRHGHPRAPGEDRSERGGAPGAVAPRPRPSRR